MKMTAEQIWREYQEGLAFCQRIGLFETVRNNENFFIGKQWEGVEARGLPTPVFNFIRRIVLYLVATTAADNIKFNASPIQKGDRAGELICKAVNGEFESIFEQNKMGLLIREFARNAAVDGDGCLYSYFDPELPCAGGLGGIRTEIVENSRVFFGNPNVRETDKQPYILLARRETVGKLRERAAAFDGEEEAAVPDGEQSTSEEDQRRGTVLHRFWKNEETGTVWCCEATRTGVVRPAWDTGLSRYPLVWLPWDAVQDCYHGQAAVTGLIPNQVFVNKLFAMSMVSLMTTAYPKVIYDKSRIPKWDARVGTAIAVTGGDMSQVARTMEPAALSPQVPQFIQLAISLTKELMGATDAALGSVRPDNTSAILALQKASGVPMELVRQNLYQCLEDLGRVWIDLMRVHYGGRTVSVEGTEWFDFSRAEDGLLTVKLDVGGSAYWSEIAQLNTLDRLLTTGRISVVDYLERLPNGYVSDQAGLIETLKEREHRRGAGDGPERGANW